MAKTAVQSITELYDSETLADIAEYGCVSGVASSHIYYTQTTEFFDKFEDEIEDYMLDNFGDDFMHEVTIGCQSLTEIKNKLTWCFIELVAQDEMYAEVA